MTETAEREPSRRELFRGIVRGLALAALTVGAGVLAARKPTKPATECTRNRSCGGCPMLDECELAAKPPLPKVSHLREGTE